ncbi:MAG: hypothetical protein PHE24_01245 [Patescibacteria group bacterium]|nr:hypothetical protein [Patescibacteria group bacterium]
MINTLLENFLIKKINPDPEIINQASESQERLREILANKLEEDNSLPSVLEGEDFLYGSAIRGTKPAPFDDVDLMLVLDGSTLVAKEGGQEMGPAYGSGKTFNPLTLPQYKDEFGNISSQKILNRIREVLSETYSRSEIRKDGQAINVWLDAYGFGIDVVPAFKIAHTRAGTHYFIPEGTNSNMWQSTNPLSDIEAFKKEDARLGGVLSSSCRLMRKWNELSNADRLSGFHVDALVYRSLFGKNITTLENALRECFNLFDQHLVLTCPQFSGFAPHIDYKLSAENRAQSIKMAQEAKNCFSAPGSGLLFSLPASTNMRLWNKIFNGELLK